MAEARRLQAELEDCGRLLGEATVETERLRELVAGWEEAIPKAQQEIECLKAAAAAAAATAATAPREVP